MVFFKKRESVILQLDRVNGSRVDSNTYTAQYRVPQSKTKDITQEN